MTWTLPLTETVLTDDDVQAVLACYEAGWLSMGPRTLAFESAVAEFCGSSHAVAVSSGSAALHLACRALGIGPGDEVVVPAISCPSVSAAPRHLGADIVVADSSAMSDPTISVVDVERRITRRTRAVIAVDTAGHPAAMSDLRALCDAHGVAVIEDAREAIGARHADGSPVGAFSDIACLSFSSGRHLDIGEGGAVVTASEQHAATMRSLRSHAMTSGTWDRHRGHSESYDVVDLGYNSRLDEPRAALGLARIGRLEAEIDARRSAVRRYRSRLAGIEGVVPVSAEDTVTRSAHGAFPILCASPQHADAVAAGLRERGIETARLPLLPGRSGPTAAELADRTVLLPLWAQITGDAVDSVCAGIQASALTPGR